MCTGYSIIDAKSEAYKSCVSMITRFDVIAVRAFREPTAYSSEVDQVNDGRVRLVELVAVAVDVVLSNSASLPLSFPRRHSSSAIKSLQSQG